MEELNQIEKEELAKRINWLINIRWVAATFPYFIFVLSAQRGEVQIGFPEIFPLVEYVLNIFYIIMVRLKKCLRFIAYFQLIVDLLLITAGVHFTGGLGSWFDIFIYFIIIIAARALLSLRASIIFAGMSSILYTTIISLEFFDILPPISIIAFKTPLPEDVDYFITSVIVRIVFFFWIAIIAGHLADIIRKRTEELMESNIKSERLERTNKELEELNRMKSEFVSTVSHELRTPLTTMKEFVSLILDEIPGKINKEQNEFLSIINENINRLSRLINNMLDLSRIESGRMELNRKKIDITTVAEQVIKFLHGQAREKDILIENLLPADLSTVYADIDKISQVLTNLVDNAIKFTQKGGKVTIEGKMVNNQVQISVIDTGIGIAKENIPQIFERFQRIELPVDKQTRGSGLGLSISKAIIEMHHGKIWVESEVGKGSNFTFSLPEFDEDIFFKNALTQKFNCALRNQLFLSLLIVSIESESGEIDGILQDVENVVKEILRGETDIIIGIKKNKSVLILSEVNSKDALSIKNRILNALVEHEFLTQEGKHIDVTINLGIATYPDDATTKDELMAKAKEDSKRRKHHVQNISCR
ncbi:MAG: ATP-binding protein [bacterium]